MDRVRRMTDLFTRGHMVVLKPCEYNDAGQVTEEGVYIWVQKANSFERAEAQRDGQASQAARLLTLSEDSEYVRALRQELVDYEVGPIIESVVQKYEQEVLVLGKQDVDASEEWREHLVLLDRWQGLSEELTKEEAEAAEKLNLEYLDAVRDAGVKRLMEKREELRGLPRDQLEEEYVDEHRKIRGLAAFQEGFAITEMFFGIRDCNAVETSPHSGEFDHKKCLHRKLLDSRAQVRTLDDSILYLVRAALEQVNMSPEQAGNLVAPTTSSKS